MTLPRLLVIMGSGETSPTMTGVHADLLDRLGPPPAPAVLLDTPYGFQENAGDITQKALTYFRENVRREMGVASFRSAEAATALDFETMLARLREARYAFAGPGSPSYALRQWRGSEVPGVLVEKLRGGGCVTFSSAAACALGRYALPVYEVYKVGEPPHWLEGLDILREAGIDGAVIPHFNNAEGGTHDTRFCYMGERRLRLLESMLDEDAAVLGVDEHTACILDLDAGTATVRGNGGVTLRRGGRERRFESGTTVPIDALRPGGEAVVAATGRPAPSSAPPDAPVPRAGDPFLDGVEEHRRAFEHALEARAVDAALAALLALDGHLWDWSRDTLDSDAMDRARSRQRTMLVQLGDLARTGARDPRELVGPFVEAILDLRRRAREERRFADADSLRDLLTGLGVEVRDARGGATEWDLLPAPGVTAGSR
jgi:cyanophycinase-like exopeptidase